MPSPYAILANLTHIARDAIALAVAWHAVVLLVSLALIFGWRPSRRLAAAVLAAPIASVAAVALVYGNLFNTVVFGALAITLVALASRLDPGAVGRGPASATIAGLALIAFGWTYPHFLESRPVMTYLVAAPTGLLPCPTLSLVIGFALLGGGFAARAWSLVLAIAGLFYGLYGYARLGVGMDVVLAAGSVVLLALAWPARRAAPGWVRS